MKKLVYLGALALTTCLFTASCEKEKEEPREKMSEKMNTQTETESDLEKPNTQTEVSTEKSSNRFFKLDMPTDMRDIQGERVNDIDDVTVDEKVTLTNKKGEEVEGFLRITVSPRRGKIFEIEASENLRKEAQLNRGSIIKLFKNPSTGGEIRDDIIELASGVGACVKSCQQVYQNRLGECGGDTSGEECRESAKRKKNVCIGACYVGWGVGVAAAIKSFFD